MLAISQYRMAGDGTSFVQTSQESTGKTATLMNVVMATSVAIFVGGISFDVSACSNMFPTEHATIHMVQYPMHMSFHVPKKLQDKRNWRHLKSSLSRVENEVRDILDTDLFHISLKDIPCSREQTNKICVVPDHELPGTRIGSATTSNHPNRPRDIPNLLIRVKSSFFHEQMSDVKKDEFSALKKSIRKERRPYVEMWRKEMKQLQEANSRIKNQKNLISIEIEKNDLDMEALEYEDLDLIRLKEQKNLLEDQNNELESRYDTLDKQREENKYKIRDLKAKIKLRVLSQFDKLLIHELLHGAGFKHSREESVIMSKGLCNIGVQGCVPQVRDSQKKRLYNSFVCQSERIGYSRVLDKAYRDEG